MRQVVILTIEQLIDLERRRLEVFKVGKGNKRIYILLPLKEILSEASGGE